MAAEILSELAPGILAKPGVKIDAGRIAFLVRVRARLGADFPVIVVTSGDRDAIEQASAMLGKLNAGGWQELYAIYQDALIDRLRPLPVDAASWAAEIQRAAEQGVLYSRHMSGRAIDLRNSNLSEQQIAELMEAVRAEGGRPLREYAPPHVHVDSPGAGSARPAPYYRAPGAAPDPLRLLPLRPPEPLPLVVASGITAVIIWFGG